MSDQLLHELRRAATSSASSWTMLAAGFSASARLPRSTPMGHADGPRRIIAAAIE